MISASCAARPAEAQSADAPAVTRTLAIRDARIVQGPGRQIERGTVVVREGLITAVGADVEIPSDARIIDDDSLTVYAGLVDGLSHVGIPEPDGEPRPENVNRADPPNDLAGIRPDREARTLLQPDDASVAALRGVGFTAAHVVPRGRMLPGTGSVVLLTGETAEEMVLRPNASLFLQFQGGPSVYPATTMGVMATLRQLLREAERRRRIERMYVEDPTGVNRPEYDPVHEALYPVLSRERPVYARAAGDDSALEVHRALQLREELGFSLALVGLHRGFDAVDALIGEGVPLFLTLDLPEAPDTTRADTSVSDTAQVMTPDEPATFFVSDLRTHSYQDVERETENLDARQALAREHYYATAARFYEADLRFGVSTLGAEPGDIRPNIRRMIDAGLPEDATLAALTIDGARLLGIDRIVGTVDVGKMANFVVVKGSYFEPDDPIRYVIVDGRFYEVPVEDSGADG